MQAEKVSTGSVELEGLSGQIEAWRGRRPKTRPMPEALWIEATVAAQKLGVYRVSRALRLNYETLKRRVGPSRLHRSRTRRDDRTEVLASKRTDFVEVSGLADLSAAAARDETVVEVVACDGTRLTIRLKRATADVAALIHALRGRS